MGRRRRIDADGAWHHVMNRGASGRTVFRSRRDGEVFETLLGSQCAAFGVEVHAYCLMPNHFHLLLRCPEGGLSAFMQQVLGQFTRHLHRSHGGDGAIFRGRFHSIATDDMRYVARIARYVHRNPLALGSVRSIEQYRWSSLRAYADRTARPDWLTTDLLSEMPDEALDASPELRPDELARLIDLLIAAHLDVDGNTHRAARRAVALALTSSSQHAVRRAAGELLTFSSDHAERQAHARAVRLLATNPGIEQIVGIVRELAG
jgi:REP element-mobilizing transposase RayT